jgi:rRNA maturation protein Nop10
MQKQKPKSVTNNGKAGHTPKPVHFSLEDLIEHRRLKISSWKHLRNTPWLVILSSPLIYACVLPFLLLDASVALYQSVCFPIYGIPKVPRKDYLVFDRGGKTGGKPGTDEMGKPEENRGKTGENRGGKPGGKPGTDETFPRFGESSHPFAALKSFHAEIQTRGCGGRTASRHPARQRPPGRVSRWRFVLRLPRTARRACR